MTTSGINTVIFPVKDLSRAKALFNSLLGVEPYADAPYYVGWKVGSQDIGLDPNGHQQGMNGPVGYFDVDDIKATIDALLGAGAQVERDVRDVGGGKLIASMKDPDGNIIGLSQNPS